MKKFVSVLVVLLIASAFVFAGDLADDGFVSFCGFGLGGGWSYERFGYESGSTRIDKDNPILISVNDFSFAKDASLGIYIDLNMILQMNTTSEMDGQNISSDDTLPLLFGATLGLSHRFDVSDNLSLLFGAGLDIAYLDEEYRYYDPVDGPGKVTISHIELGVGAEIAAKFNLGSGYALSAGAKASAMFINFVTKETTSWTGTKDNYESYSESKSFFGYRIMPKISFMKTF
ncbi:MAG: outer membrane beta-barrel protein [Spirochaetales bacterium]|nr:outer membrane beta-barrel protein [Spirochaetales bacterium]